MESGRSATNFSRSRDDMSILRKNVRRFINRIIYGHKVNSVAYLKYLRGLGMQIDEGCCIIAGVP